MIAVYVAERGAIRNYWDWFTSESDSISRDFDTYEDAEEFAKVVNRYGFDALIVNLMVGR